MIDSCDIAIVGAGAAGLAAAIFAAEAARQSSSTERPSRIVLLDGAKSIGAKILVSGGGRCNVTHDVVRVDDFNASSKNIVRNILAAFDETATLRWFESIGVTLKREETGKIFPTSDSAKAVLYALMRRCDELGITILAGHRVIDVRQSDPGTDAEPPSKSLAVSRDQVLSLATAAHDSAKPQATSSAPEDADLNFTIVHDHGELRAARVVMATGGRSLPKTGSDGGGWEILRRLGHSVTETYPALVPLMLDARMFHASVSGLSHDAELTTLADGKPIDRRRGSLLWTHFGISGPVAMDASRHWVIAQARGGNAEMRCSFVPGMTFEMTDAWLLGAFADRPRAAITTILAAKIPERLARALLEHLKIDPTTPASQVSKDSRRTIVHALTALSLPILRDRGWNYAEVTAGGVPLGEIDFRTMESRKVPGLYLVGELLDCEGRIGGFNFQWAWSTGFVAGQAIARIFPK